MDTARDRFIQTMRFERPDQPFTVAGGMWAETAELWRTQGWDGRPLHEIFGTDAYFGVAPYYGPAPDFGYRLVEEDESIRLYVNHEGILMREFKAHRDTSMPQFVKFPVENLADYEQLERERLGLNLELRLTPQWKEGVAKAAASQWPRRCWADRWGGFFGSLRNLMGVEGLCVAFYDDPGLVERMMAQRAELMISLTEQVLRHTRIETFWFWEDMAYNHGSLIDPRLFRKFALPHYRRVVEWLNAQGIRNIGLDSDGDITELIPLWLDAGVNFLWPFEVAAHMDVLEVRKQYGHALAFGGGIPKSAVAEGGETMRRAVDRVMPLMEDGGYIPELDHGAPPDISWKNYREYMEYLLFRMNHG